MPLTRNFRDNVQRHVEGDVRFRRVLLRESVECMLSGDVETGKKMLRGYINATIGFSKLAEAMHRSPKSLMRMFSPSGNPRARNLFEIVAWLQQNEDVRLRVRVTPGARVVG